MRIRAGAAKIVADLFQAYMNDPRQMQSHYWVDHIAGLADAAKARHVGDYLAGMTDTYAISAHKRLFDQTPDLR
jgi:dGTPase